MLFTQKYAPRKLDEILENDEAKERVRKWILNWIRGKKQKPLLVHGPPGIGKSSLAHALESEFDLELIEMNASDLRDRGRIEKVLNGALQAGSLFGKRKLLFIDDVDALQKSDVGGTSAIARLLKESSQPILVTATNAWEKKIAGIRIECELIELKRVSKPSIAKLLRKIAEKEKLEITEERLNAILQASNGDVRAAINDLQAFGVGIRDREKDIFDRVRMVFKSITYADARKAVEGDIDYNLLKLWIDENIPAEYEMIEELAEAYHWISRADIFEGRIKKSHWGYLKYMFDLMTVGVALSKKQKYYKFTRYQFPKYLKMMAQTSEHRAMLKTIGKKIGVRTHESWKFSLAYLPLLKEIGKKNKEKLANFYEFNDDELAFLLNNANLFH